TYQIKLTVDGKTYSAPLVVAKDPRVKTTQADFDKQYQFALELRGRVNDVNNTVNLIRSTRKTLDERKQANPSQASAIDAIEQKMAGIEEQLIQVASVTRWAGLVYPIELDAQYGDLMNVVESADSAPPAQVYQVFQSYETKRIKLMAEWKSAQEEIARLGGE
ncbi:MAG: hypothetical protein ACRD5L_16205, partial [Bryobacteraceae bacterium]